jgi:hypothetical protein
MNLSIKSLTLSDFLCRHFVLPFYTTPKDLQQPVFSVNFAST